VCVDTVAQPIQRLPRYQMLLGDLLRNTDQGHLDYDNINAALEGITAATVGVNRYVRVCMYVCVSDA
jgi:hypothetical protein